MRQRYGPIPILLSVILPAIIVASALAHGIGKPQLLNVVSGPYLISAWTDPDPLREDETHVVIAVTDPAKREPIVSGVEVTVTMTSLDNPAVVLTETAGTDNVNRLLYAAEFNGRVTSGRWRVGLQPSGDLGVGDEVTFDVEVEPGRGFNWLWLGLGGMAAVVLVWFGASMRSGSSPAARRGRQAEG